MEHTTAAPLQSGARRPTSVDERPNDAIPAGAQMHPLELRRVQAGYATQRALADAAGVSLQQHGNIVHGRSKSWRTETVRRYASALQVPLEVLLHELHSPQSGVTTDQPRVVSLEGDAGREDQR